MNKKKPVVKKNITNTFYLGFADPDGKYIDDYQMTKSFAIANAFKYVVKINFPTVPVPGRTKPDAEITIK